MVQTDDLWRSSTLSKGSELLQRVGPVGNLLVVYAVVAGGLDISGLGDELHVDRLDGKGGLGNGLDTGGLGGDGELGGDGLGDGGPSDRSPSDGDGLGAWSVDIRPFGN